VNYCAECGFKIEGEFKFCPNCGSQIKLVGSFPNEVTTNKDEVIICKTVEENPLKFWCFSCGI
jgi:uncharacterized membrane protein YvbJ